MEKDAIQADNNLSPRELKEMLVDLKLGDLNHVILKYQIDEDSIKNYVRESSSAKELAWVLDDKPDIVKTKTKTIKSKKHTKTIIEGGYVSKQHPKFIIQNINLDDFNLSDNGADFLINNKLYMGEK